MARRSAHHDLHPKKPTRCPMQKLARVGSGGSPDGVDAGPVSIDGSRVIASHATTAERSVQRDRQDSLFRNPPRRPARKAVLTGRACPRDDCVRAQACSSGRKCPSRAYAPSSRPRARTILTAATMALARPRIRAGGTFCNWPSRVPLLPDAAPATRAPRGDAAGALSQAGRHGRACAPDRARTGPAGGTLGRSCVGCVA